MSTKRDCCSGGSCPSTIRTTQTAMTHRGNDWLGQKLLGAHSVPSNTLRAASEAIGWAAYESGSTSEYGPT